MKIIKLSLFYLSILLNITFLFYGFHFVWNTKYRVEINHGINLPETTNVIKCSGNRFEIEGHTTSHIQIHSIQLTKFLKELDVKHETIDTVKSNIVHHLSCKSPIGDSFIVSYILANSSYCNITLDTDWN